MYPRKQMMIPEDLIYLNHASIGPLPKTAYQAYQSKIEGLAREGEGAIDIEEMIMMWDNVRSEFARLINGSTDGVTLTTNTASALHIVADGLHQFYSPGKNIVITELEFTTNSFIWQRLTHRHNMELRVARFETGFNDWHDLIDDNTILVSISFVQFSNGYRADLQQISQICKEHNAYLAVDAIQGLGAVPFDVHQLGVDFVAAGGYKWLLGPMGSGYFYMRPELLDKVDSILVGWFSDRDFHDMSHHEFHPWEDARKFQQSISPTYHAQIESLKVINQWGVGQNYQHIITLQDRLIEGIQGTSFQLQTILDSNHRSGIIKLDHSDAETIVKKLKTKGIIVSYRDGGVRISPHRHNSEEEIDELITQLKMY